MTPRGELRDRILLCRDSAGVMIRQRYLVIIACGPGRRFEHLGNPHCCDVRIKLSMQSIFSASPHGICERGRQKRDYCLFRYAELTRHSCEP
ncbi:hypothetical protein PoB_006914000 [Plakobranchus ocellatus]|uniref:Uncharacterized protein n=1 Tax=Plakobranchus ocellatus TaxID=259542 RepID=A0AAV4DF77_9GAST|nr:hypothetical protein PoB_006914000 [Plakobranchus ocellatus]